VKRNSALVFIVLMLLGLAVFELHRSRDGHPHRPSATSETPPPAATSDAAPIAAQVSPGGGKAGFPSTTSQPTAANAALGAGSLPEDGKLSESALRQIAALQEEKSKRTPTQRKIDSQLLYAEMLRRGESVAFGVSTLRVNLDKDVEGRVEVDITAEVADELLRWIADAGGKVVNSFAQLHAIRAWMPLAQIEPLAEHEGVKFIRAAVQGTTDTGGITSEGDYTHKASVGRSTFGITGAGSKVGVLSDSVDHLAESQATGELGVVTVLANQAGTGTGEGTAMLEIIHDLAPGAELFFATAYGGAAHYAQNIRDLRFKYGCDVIVDDVHYNDESPFQDGVIAQAVIDVTADGAMYFGTARNAGNKNDGTSGTWEGDFQDSGQSATIPPFVKSGKIHSFGAATFNTLTTNGSSYRADLFWTDPLGFSTNDYDLYILNSTGTAVVSASTSSQTGQQDPYESVNRVRIGERVVVVLYSGISRFLHLDTGRGCLSVNTAGRTRGHPCVPEAFSVAAVSAAGASPTSVFVGGSKHKVEKFSSDGPRRVFFNPDGSSISVGNFSSTGGTVRQKPDVTAANRGKTSVPGFETFPGTSAAAPHAAAIAALLKSYNPSLTPAEIRTALTSTALDIESPGVDRDAGYGIVMADAALRSVPPPVPPTITSFSPTLGPSGTNVTITGSNFKAVTNVTFNGTSANFTVVSLTQIAAIVPAGATSGVIGVATRTGTAVSLPSFTVQGLPSIVGFTPSSATVGASVVIAGANFTGATSVRFNGTSATFTVNSATQITATVPAGTTTGRITITTGTGTGTSAGNFTVTALPLITSFSPTSGPAGTVVTINGANFTGLTSVRFNGTSSTGSFNAIRILATVPASATTGPISVTTTNGTATTAGGFVVVPAPSVSGFTPNTAPVGAQILINGNNLAGSTNVTFNGISAVFLINSTTQIVANVPAGNSGGLIRVSTPGGIATSAGTFSPLLPPPNDNFASAQILSGNSGTTTTTNTAATKEGGEPSHASNRGGKSIWFQWTAPASGAWTFTTAGSSFDTTIAIYTGTALSNLTLVAANDDNSTGNTSSVTILATNGTTYRLAVDGYNPDEANAGNASSGIAVLAWSLAAGAPVISSFTPSSGVPGAAVTIRGTNFTNPVTVSFNGIPATITSQSLAALNVIVPVGATTGSILVGALGGSVIGPGDFQVLNPPSNDRFGSAQPIAGTSGSVSGNNVDAGMETGEPNHAGQLGGRSIWYRWVAPTNGAWAFDTHGSTVDTLLAVYTGSSVSNLTLVATNDDSGAEISSSVAFNAIAGQEYRIAVDAVGGEVGTLTLNWNFLGEAPAITDFSPAMGGQFSQVFIRGLNLSNVTAVLFGGMTSPGFTNDSPMLVRAQVPLGGTNGPITVVCASGNAVSASSFTVTDAPPNDNTGSARLLSGSFNILSANNENATKETGEPNHGGNAGGKSLWFTWVAPSNGVWVFDTSGSAFDTLLGIYTTNSIGNLTNVVGNDDVPGFAFSSATFTAVSGRKYWIAVDGYNGASGDFVLRFQPALDPLTFYSANFGTGQGYNPSLALAGQQGWLQTGTGGNGIVTNFFSSSLAQAYIGYSGGNNLQLERPFNYTPDLATRPIVRFSVKMQVFDSTNFQYDHFRWRFYNQSSQRLFSIDFNNADFSIATVLDGAAATNNFSATTFDNSTAYTLSVVMDFSSNRWSAFLDERVIVANQPITTTGAALNLRSVAVAWVQNNALNPGDNYLVFDDYVLSAEAADKPSIIALSSSKTVTAGSRTSVAVIASGSAPLSYQWRFNGVAIPGATNAILGFPGITTEQAGGYSVVVSNPSGSATSGTTVLTVNSPPLITSHPVGRVVPAGSNFTFVVTAAGAPPLSYQWRRNGTNLPQATQASLTLTNVSRANAGVYAVVVSNLFGTATSANAGLRVLVSQSVDRPQQLAGGGFRLRFGDTNGFALFDSDKVNFVVQWSTNLLSTNWFDLTNGIPSVVNGKVEIDDADAAGKPRRFYRVIER
jgi:hypothetical protein